MKSGTRKFCKTLGLICILFAGVMIFDGCKKKAEPVPTEAAKEALSAAVEQTTCPVMGGAVNKEIFIEYKGKKVYFCCPACKPEFEKDPEKYIDKLPQFKN